jgi:hypothetical protein
MYEYHLRLGCMRSEDQTEFDLEGRKLAWLRFWIDLHIAQLYQDPSLDILSGRKIVRQVRNEVVKVFPDKAETFDLILLPRFNRVLIERWGEGIDKSIQ